MKRVTVNQEALESLFKVISDSGAKNDYVHIKTPIKQFCKSWLAELDPQAISSKSLLLVEKGAPDILIRNERTVNLNNHTEVFDLEEEGHNGKWKF